MKRKVSWAAALAGMAGVAVAAGVLSGAAPSAASETAAAVSAVSAAAPTVPVLAWKPCDDGFQCATAQVPLNYRDPGGAQISIAVISHKATGPGPGRLPASHFWPFQWIQGGWLLALSGLLIAVTIWLVRRRVA